MANTLPLKERMQNVIDAKIHSTYEEAVGKPVEICKSFASRLIGLIEGDRLPNYTQPQAQQVQHLLANYQKTTFQDWLMCADAATIQLLNWLGQLEKEPADGNARNNAQNGFQRASADFLITWNFLAPALEASSPQQKHFQKQARALDEILQRAKATDAEFQAIAALDSVAKHAGHFDALSTKYNFRAIRALTCTILLVIALIVAIFAITKWELHVPSDDHALLTQVIVGRVLMIAALYFLVVLAAKSYRANAHLAAVNLHRATALSTFQTFSNTPTSSEVRDAILLETARCVYTQTSTGFLPSEEPSSPTQIIEILSKAIGPKT